MRESVVGIRWRMTREWVEQMLSSLDGYRLSKSYVKERRPTERKRRVDKTNDVEDAAETETAICTPTRH